MAKYRVRCYREIAGWVYVDADSSKKAVYAATMGDYDSVEDEAEVSRRFVGEVEGVDE